MEGNPESLNYPRPEEQADFSEFGDEVKLEEAHELPTERIEKILRGEENIGLFNYEDLEETLLRRKMAAEDLEGGGDGGGGGLLMNPNLIVFSAFVIFIIFAFFGWTLYKSLREKEKKREEKKKLKQKKKK